MQVPAKNMKKKPIRKKSMHQKKSLDQTNLPHKPI